MKPIKYWKPVLYQKKGFTLIEVVVALGVASLFFMMISLSSRSFLEISKKIKYKIELEQNALFLISFIREDLKVGEALEQNGRNFIIYRGDESSGLYTLAYGSELKYSKYGKSQVGLVALASHVRSFEIEESKDYFELKISLEKEGVEVEKRKRVLKNTISKEKRIYND